MILRGSSIPNICRRPPEALTSAGGCIFRHAQVRPDNRLQGTGDRPFFRRYQGLRAGPALLTLEAWAPTMNSNRSNGEWIALGVALGIAFGVAFDNIGVGIAVGIAVGVAIGAGRSRRQQ